MTDKRDYTAEEVGEILRDQTNEMETYFGHGFGFGLADAGTAVEDLIDILGADHDEEECHNLADLIEEVRATITRLRKLVNGHKTINEYRVEKDLPPLQGGDIPDVGRMWAHDVDAKICGKSIVSTQEALYAGSSLPSANWCRLSPGHEGACNALLVGHHPKRTDGNTAALHD
jgi:hypothetical protein